MQGKRHLILGATKEHGWTAQQALEDCGNGQGCRQAIPGQVIAQLMPGLAVGSWPGMQAWQPLKVRSGVRALPPRTAEGSIPLAGRLSDPAVIEGRQHQCELWVIGGLGARGLVYHAWLGQLIAEAVLTGSDAKLPSQLKRWQIAKEI